MKIAPAGKLLITIFALRQALHHVIYVLCRETSVHAVVMHGGTVASELCNISRLVLAYFGTGEVQGAPQVQAFAQAQQVLCAVATEFGL